MKKAIMLIIAMLIVLPMVMMLGCSGGGSSSPVSLVPQNVNMIGQINLSSILSDSDLVGLYKDVANHRG